MGSQIAEQIARGNCKYHLVVAAAGSGKTQLLVDVVARRFEQGLVDIDKRKLVIFTFTNSAADELSVRLGDVLQKYRMSHAQDSIFIGTIHSWCRQYLDDKKAILGLRNLGKHVLGASIVDLDAKKSRNKIEVNVKDDKIKGVEQQASSSLKEVASSVPRTRPSLTACSICDVSTICPDRISSK